MLAREPKVENLDVHVLIDEHVVKFQISVSYVLLVHML